MRVVFILRHVSALLSSLLSAESCWRLLRIKFVSSNESLYCLKSPIIGSFRGMADSPVGSARRGKMKSAKLLPLQGGII